MAEGSDRESVHSVDSEPGRARRTSPGLGNTICQPEDVKIARWSQDSTKLRAFAYGNFRRHDYAGLSKVPAEQLAAFRRGTTYVCLMCREGDYPEDVGLWPETKGNSNTVFQTSGDLDRHVLSYHMPFVSAWSCPGNDGFICLTRDVMKKHFREVTFEHQNVKGYPRMGTEHYLTRVAEFVERIVPLKDSLEVKTNPYHRVPHLPLGQEIRVNEKHKNVLQVGPYLINMKIFKQREGLEYTPAWAVLRKALLLKTTDLRRLEADMRAQVPCVRIPSEKGIVFFGPREARAQDIHRLPGDPPAAFRDESPPAVVRERTSATPDRQRTTAEEDQPSTPTASEDSRTESRTPGSQRSEGETSFESQPGTPGDVPTPLLYTVSPPTCTDYRYRNKSGADTPTGRVDRDR